MEESYQHKQYTVKVSYHSEDDENPTLTFRVIDETIFKEFQDSFSIWFFAPKLSEVKKMMHRFFSSASNFTLKITQVDGTVVMHFNVLTDDIEVRQFSLTLPCIRKLGEVEQLRLEFTRLKTRMSESEKLVRFLMNMHEKIVTNGTSYTFGDKLFTASDNCEELINTDRIRFQPKNSDDKLCIEPFASLKSLVMENLAHDNIEETGARNEFVEELNLDSCYTLTSLKGIEHMPNLKCVKIKDCPSANPSFLFTIEHQITEIHSNTFDAAMIQRLKDNGIECKTIE